MPEPDSGVVTAPPAEGGETPPAQQPAPSGSEPDNNSGGGNGEQQVPYTRFQEVNDKAKAAEERAAKAEQELQAERDAKQQTPPPSSDEDDVDPEVAKLVKTVIAKEGYVKKDEVQSQVQAVEARRQYQEDTKALTDKYAETGVPFVLEDVRKFAQDNKINITGKSSLEAAYKVMNEDKILDNVRNAAITDFKENGGKSSAEKPGSGGAQQPEEPEVSGDNPGAKLRSRIANARKKL